MTVTTCVRGGPPTAAGLFGWPPGLRGRRLRRLDVVGARDVRIAGERALQVALHTGEVPDQALDVEIAQHRHPPLPGGERAQHGMERVGGPAERLDRRDRRDPAPRGRAPARRSAAASTRSRSPAAAASRS